MRVLGWAWFIVIATALTLPGWEPRLDYPEGRKLWHEEEPLRHMGMPGAAWGLMGALVVALWAHKEGFGSPTALLASLLSSLSPLSAAPPSVLLLLLSLSLSHRSSAAVVFLHLLTYSFSHLTGEFALILMALADAKLECAAAVFLMLLNPSFSLSLEVVFVVVAGPLGFLSIAPSSFKLWVWLVYALLRLSLSTVDTAGLLLSCSGLLLLWPLGLSRHKWLSAASVIFGLTSRAHLGFTVGVASIMSSAALLAIHRRRRDSGLSPLRLMLLLPVLFFAVFNIWQMARSGGGPPSPPLSGQSADTLEMVSWMRLNLSPSNAVVWCPAELHNILYEWTNATLLVGNSPLDASYLLLSQQSAQGREVYSTKNAAWFLYRAQTISW